MDDHTEHDRHNGVGDRFGIPPRSDWVTELVGTAMLMAIGLSAVVVLFSTKSPVATTVTNIELRRLVAGLFFVTTSAFIIYSPLGRRGGGHLNPAITVGFTQMKKLRWQGTLTYVSAQLVGALGGAAVVEAMFGSWATRVHLGVPTPGRLGPGAAAVAELLLSFVLMSVVLHCVDRPALMRFAPIAAGLTTLACVLIETPASTTSLNPARVLGPAVLARDFDWWWIYLFTPILGAWLAALAFQRTRGVTPCAKLFHTQDYECHFRHCAYREAASAREGAVS